MITTPVVGGTSGYAVNIISYISSNQLSEWNVSWDIVPSISEGSNKRANYSLC